MSKEKDQIDEVALGERLLLSEVEVAWVCGVSQPVVRRWRAEGLLRTVELPFNLRRNLYRRSDVEAFVAGLGTDGDRASRARRRLREAAARAR